MQKALDDLRDGRFILLVDNKNRENEADLIISAEKVNEEKMAFMIRAGGLVCVALHPEIIERLQIPLMVKNNTDKVHTNFTVSIDHKNTGTGISAGDRALTIKALADSSSRPEDFTMPGHVFPLKAKKLGERKGHTEASVHLAMLAGITPAVAICELLNDKGRQVRGKELEGFSQKHGIRIVRIDELEQLEQEGL